MPYAILLDDLQSMDFQKTAKALARAQGLLYADATRIVRTCCGILARNLTLEKAKSISEELNKEGIGVFFMDEGRMHQPARPATINNADCMEGCLNVHDLYGRFHPLSWTDIILISLGRFIERTEKKESVSPRRRRYVTRFDSLGRVIGPLIGTVSDGGALGFSPKRKVIEEEHFVLDIFSTEAQGKHYRIKQKAFNYDYLGGRLKASSIENFRLLVEDVVGYAKGAYGNRGINAYLPGESLENLNYDSLEAFDKENFWLLQLIQLELEGTGEGKSNG
jgi:hypothetical protein